MKQRIDGGDDLDSLNLFLPFVKRAMKNQKIFLDSARKYGTPQYILDEDFLVDNVREIKKNFSKDIVGFKLFYAFKSNDLPYMIRLLKEEGVNADVSCMFEMQLALKLGFEKIIYTAPYKSLQELEYAVNSGKIIINIDNVDEFNALCSLCKRLKKSASISFRIRTKNNNWKKFGITNSEFVKLANVAMKDPLLNWTGVHFHKSWNIDAKSYVDGLTEIADCLKENFSHEQLSRLKFIDIGGGLLPFESISVEDGVEMPCSIKQFSDVICSAVKKNIFEKLNINPEIWLEPGRLISSQATSILLTVKATKESESEYIVDGGTNLLGSPMFEEDYFPVVNISAPSEKLTIGKINGPLCDPADHWGKYYFGEKLKNDDLISVLNMGAYTFSTAWRWQRAIPKYVTFSARKGKSVIVKDEESFEDRYSGCKI
jgi:diaminopimelate decarboxylase